MELLLYSTVIQRKSKRKWQVVNYTQQDNGWNSQTKVHVGGAAI